MNPAYPPASTMLADSSPSFPPRMRLSPFAAVLALSLSFPALAEESKPAPAPAAEADPEVMEEVEQMFTELDKDGSGAITVEEVKAVVGEQIKAQFGDQAAPLVEMVVKQFMGNCDADRNGTLEKKELVKLIEGQRAQLAGAVAGWFTEVDGDGDGKLTRKEYLHGAGGDPVRAQDAFDQLEAADLNGDQILTLAELRASLSVVARAGVLDQGGGEEMEEEEEVQ